MISLNKLEEDTKNRFGLRDQQMRSDIKGMPFAKNQWWFLKTDGGDIPVLSFGYGDLSEDDVLRIAEMLADRETFVCFNEHDGYEAFAHFKTPFELGMTPRMIVTNKDIEFPDRRRMAA